MWFLTSSKAASAACASGPGEDIPEYQPDSCVPDDAGKGAQTEIERKIPGEAWPYPERKPFMHHDVDNVLGRVGSGCTPEKIGQAYTEAALQRERHSKHKR